MAATPKGIQPPCHSPAGMGGRGYGQTGTAVGVRGSCDAPGRPGLVVVGRWIERRGRKTCFLEGRLLDGEGNVLAKGSSTAMLADRSRVEAAAQAALEA